MNNYSLYKQYCNILDCNEYEQIVFRRNKKRCTESNYGNSKKIASPSEQIQKYIMKKYYNKQIGGESNAS